MGKMHSMFTWGIALFVLYHAKKWLKKGTGMLYSTIKKGGTKI